MAQIEFFKLLQGRLHKADSQPPAESTFVLGFTNEQILKLKLNAPKLVYYDARTKTFHDQGAYKKGDKATQNMIAMKRYKEKPMKNLKYYIPIDGELLEESKKHQYK